jgi:hypothetical protein
VEKDLMEEVESPANAQMEKAPSRHKTLPILALEEEVAAAAETWNMDAQIPQAMEEMEEKESMEEEVAAVEEEEVEEVKDQDTMEMKEPEALMEEVEALPVVEAAAAGLVAGSLLPEEEL